MQIIAVSSDIILPRPFLKILGCGTLRRVVTLFYSDPFLKILGYGTLRQVVTLFYPALNVINIAASSDTILPRPLIFYNTDNCGEQ